MKTVVRDNYVILLKYRNYYLPFLIKWIELIVYLWNFISLFFQENTCLKVLDLSSNGVNNAGAECIAKALIQNRTLEELNLNGNRVGLAGLINIFKALGTNDCLKFLRVS